jgi:hypothetical protein
MQMSCLRAKSGACVMIEICLRSLSQLDGGVRLAMMSVLKFQSSRVVECGLGSTP